MPALVFACFLLSGASGLVFEMVWTRELTLVFGSTTLAISTVLSVFMGGLALGSFLAGRFADRARSPVVLYALAEAGVGLYALAVPLVLAFYPRLNPLFVALAGRSALVLALLRFVATAVVLLIPTTLMGATLPLLSRHLVRQPRELGGLGARVGLLYAFNTFGAVAGTAIAGFVLLPEAGVRASNWCAAGVNLTLCALILLARRQRSVTGNLPEVEPEPELDADDPDPRIDKPLDNSPPPAGATATVKRIVLAAFFVSGATAMVYQVLWSRALAIVIGSSVYSFTLILLAFLVGLAVGASVMARIMRGWGARPRPLSWLAATHVGLVVTVLVSMALIDKLPAGFLALLRPAKGQMAGLTVDEILFYQFLLAALPVLPATLFMGGVLPLTVRILSVDLARVGRDVGDAYSVNTLGAIVGSFAAGFVVLPGLGLDRGLRAAALSSTIVAVAVLAICEASLKIRRALVALVTIGALAVIALMPKWDLSHFQAGLFRVSLTKEIIESGNWAIPELLYYKDGISTTVSVERWGKHLALKNNGKVDASNGDDMATQVMVGLMPLLLHPTALVHPPRVAVVGYGSGVTVGAVTQFPIGTVDVVELEPAVVEGARYFSADNHEPDKNPKVTIRTDDGRNFLGQATDPYDVIISEPSNPWITGVSNLFTRDYWTMARKRLADDGVFCQWAQLYELSPLNVKIILRTFSQVFPYTYVFAAEDLSSDLILVAANHPLPLDLAHIAANFRNPVLKAELVRGDVKSPEDVVAQLLLTPDELGAYTLGAPINTDDNALIEFSAPRDLLGYMRYDSYLMRIYGADWPYGRFEPFLTGLGDASPTGKGASEARLSEALVAHGKRRPAMRMATSAITDGGTGADHALRLVNLLDPRTHEEEEIPLASEADPLDAPTVPKNLTPAEQEKFARDYALLESEMHHHRWAHALKAIGEWPERWVDEAGQDFQLVMGYLLYKTDLEDDALDHLKPLAQDAAYCKRRPAVLYYEARAYYSWAIYGAGTREMRKYMDLTPPPPSPSPSPLPSPSPSPSPLPSPSRSPLRSPL